MTSSFARWTEKRWWWWWWTRWRSWSWGRSNFCHFSIESYVKKVGKKEQMNFCSLSSLLPNLESSLVERFFPGRAKKWSEGGWKSYLRHDEENEKSFSFSASVNSIVTKQKCTQTHTKHIHLRSEYADWVTGLLTMTAIDNFRRCHTMGSAAAGVFIFFSLWWSRDAPKMRKRENIFVARLFVLIFPHFEAKTFFHSSTLVSFVVFLTACTHIFGPRHVIERVWVCLSRNAKKSESISRKS